MKPPIQLSDLKNSACAHLNQHLFEVEKKVKRQKKVSKEKVWIQHTLEVFAREKGLVLSTEYVFHTGRNWRFDWSFNEQKIFVEYEGIISKKSRHTTIGGFTGDVNKYNVAEMDGWKMLRYTALNYLDLRIDLLNLKL